jgi:hypothetical protein
MGTKWNGILRRKSPKAVRPETHARNLRWREICMARANYLMEKYGYLICEYSGERIECLSLCYSGDNDGWGHHIDKNRDHVYPNNCYLVKYKYHRKITDEHIQVEQEDFQGRKGDTSNDW